MSFSPRNLLEELGAKHHATKLRHDYLKRYAELFDHRREAVSSVLEIGVQEGGSVRMWEEYFPNATILGLDIDPAYKKHEGGRRIILIGDSTSKGTADIVRAHHPDSFDLVIDDGSHHPADQVSTFETFFPLVKKGGMYAIEDIGHTRGPLRLVVNQHLSELIHGINFWPRNISAAQLLTVDRFETGNYWIKNIVGIRFFRALTIIEKGDNPGENPFAGARDLPTGSLKDSRRPRFRTSRLREVRFPWQFRRHRFVSYREVKPEPQWRLLVRWLVKRW